MPNIITHRNVKMYTSIPECIMALSSECNCHSMNINYVSVLENIKVPPHLQF